MPIIVSQSAFSGAWRKVFLENLFIFSDEVKKELPEARSCDLGVTSVGRKKICVVHIKRCLMVPSGKLT